MIYIETRGSRHDWKEDDDEESESDDLCVSVEEATVYRQQQIFMIGSEYIFFIFEIS